MNIQNDRFPALSRRVSRLKIMGQVVIALGVILALVVLITALTNDSNEIKVGGVICAGIIVLVCLVIAEGFFLAAESIGVFLAIEMNTRGISHEPTTEVVSEEKVQKPEEETQDKVEIQEGIQFADKRLENIIRGAIRTFEGAILKSDLKGLTKLDATVGKISRAGKITDLSGIEHCTELQRLDLRYNQISDISPLVNNSGIGEGDRVDLRDNPLNDEAYEVHITALQERGVEVLFDPKP
jgi:hypothetical protein